jgi:glucokinase
MNEQNNRAEKVWAGVDIGGTKTAVVLSAEPPTILTRTEFATQPAQGPDRALNLIKNALADACRSHHISRNQLTAIGISCGGPLDRTTGVIQSPPNLHTWSNVPIVSILQDEFGVACRLENDANAGAVAEHRFGAGKGAYNMVFLTMGTGMGAGIILNGQLYHGACDLAGEIGHVRLTQDGPTGHNKSGSVEGWASGGGIAQLAMDEIKTAAKKGEPTSFAELISQGDEITAKKVGLLAAQGDALAKRIIQRAGHRLGEALAILVDILNPERIVIGGLAMRLGADLWEPAMFALKQEALAASVKHCQIVPAALGEKIGDIAAICVAQGL